MWVLYLTTTVTTTRQVQNSHLYMQRVDFKFNRNTLVHHETSSTSSYIVCTVWINHFILLFGTTSTILFKRGWKITTHVTNPQASNYNKNTHKLINFNTIFNFNAYKTTSWSRILSCKHGTTTNWHFIGHHLHNSGYHKPKHANVKLFVEYYRDYYNQYEDKDLTSSNQVPKEGSIIKYRIR